MQTVYDAEGNELGAMPLSEKQQAALDAGRAIAVQFHTPHSFQSTLGHRAGSFILYKDGDRLISLSGGSAKEFFELQAAIRRGAH